MHEKQEVIYLQFACNNSNEKWIIFFSEFSESKGMKQKHYKLISF